MALAFGEPHCSAGWVYRDCYFGSGRGFLKSRGVLLKVKIYEGWVVPVAIKSDPQQQ